MKYHAQVKKDEVTMWEFIWQTILPWVGVAFIVATGLVLALLGWAALLLKIREPKQTVRYSVHFKHECDMLLTGVKHLLNKTQDKG